MTSVTVAVKRDVRNLRSREWILDLTINQVGSITHLSIFSALAYVRVETHLSYLSAISLFVPLAVPAECTSFPVSSFGFLFLFFIPRVWFRFNLLDE